MESLSRQRVVRDVVLSPRAQLVQLNNSPKTICSNHWIFNMSRNMSSTLNQTVSSLGSIFKLLCIHFATLHIPDNNTFPPDWIPKQCLKGTHVFGHDFHSLEHAIPPCIRVHHRCARPFLNCSLNSMSLHFQRYTAPPARPAAHQDWNSLWSHHLVPPLSPEHCSYSQSCYI